MSDDEIAQMATQADEWWNSLILWQKIEVKQFVFKTENLAKQLALSFELDRQVAAKMILEKQKVVQLL